MQVTDGVTVAMTGIHTGDVDVTATLHQAELNSPGHYRLRVHARGRDTAVDLSPHEITEWYLIQAWPAAAREARVLSQIDRYGASVRAR
ncbi:MULTISPECIES: hypothetical protein [unclassified Streptomyces]|uniref:hypothetical protein n=1 Tax=unclassified Streptomyces TaxID=2593676 RepID=UPI0036E526EA